MAILNIPHFRIFVKCFCLLVSQFYFFFPLFFSGVCANAEAATLLVFLGVEGLDSNFEAVEATFFDVTAFLAIAFSLLKIE